MDISVDIQCRPERVDSRALWREEGYIKDTIKQLLMRLEVASTVQKFYVIEVSLANDLEGSWPSGTEIAIRVVIPGGGSRLDVHDQARFEEHLKGTMNDRFLNRLIVVKLELPAEA